MKNNQMRAIAKFLEDHGVNMVFNGHEHNYQRTNPLRANGNVAAGPSPVGPAAVSIDTSFDGVSQTVPDGVLYMVEGAGGNRDFDGDLNPARGSGLGIDQDDSATGNGSVSTFMFPNGPASWLDTNLTDNEMSPVLPGAGSGPENHRSLQGKDLFVCGPDRSRQSAEFLPDHRAAAEHFLGHRERSGTIRYGRQRKSDQRSDSRYVGGSRHGQCRFAARGWPVRPTRQIRGH